MALHPSELFASVFGPDANGLERLLAFVLSGAAGFAAAVIVGFLTQFIGVSNSPMAFSGPAAGVGCGTLIGFIGGVVVFLFVLQFFLA